MRGSELLEKVFGTATTRPEMYVFSEPPDSWLVADYLRANHTTSWVASSVPIESQRQASPGYLGVVTFKATHVMPRNVKAKKLFEYMVGLGEMDHDDFYAFAEPGRMALLKQELLTRLRRRDRVFLPQRAGIAFNALKGERLVTVFLGTSVLPHVSPQA